MRAVIYARVSTDEQTTDNQTQELRALAERAGWEVVHEYIDQGISGAKGRDKRPAFDQLHRDATRRQFDVILAWSVDRLGRSLAHLVSLIGHLEACHVDLVIHQQGMDTTTPGGKAMFQMCGVFAEFERSMIQERVKAGMKRAKAAGKNVGRPRALDLEGRNKARRLRAEGRSYNQIASALFCGKATVIRAVRGEN